MGVVGAQAVKPCSYCRRVVKFINVSVEEAGALDGRKTGQTRVEGFQERVRGASGFQGQLQEGDLKNEGPGPEVKSGAENHRKTPKARDYRCRARGSVH